MLKSLYSSRKPVAVKLQRFWCDDIPFIAYQLPNGEIAMSQTQSLPNASTVLQKTASEFMKTNRFPWIRATLPNRTETVLYPLSTITALWNHLHNMGELPFREKLLFALEAGIPVKEDPDQVGDFVVRVETAPLGLAKVFLVQVEKFSLRVLLHKGKIFIPDHEALTVINAPLSWLIEINPAQKKARILKQKGFSYNEELLYFQDRVVFQVKTHSLSDWLVVWEYFASKGNTKALSLLRHLALEGLARQVC